VMESSLASVLGFGQGLLNYRTRSPRKGIVALKTNNPEAKSFSPGHFLGTI
jgi:hypothetical protein